MSEVWRSINHPSNTYTGVHVATFKGHSNSVTKICANTTADNRIISTSKDKSIIVWRLKKEDNKLIGSNISTLIEHEASISDCSLSRRYASLSTSSYDKTVKVWDLNAGKCQRTFSGHWAEVWCVTYDEDEQKIISGSKDKSVRLWDMRSDQERKNTTAHCCPITCLNVLYNRKTSAFISAGENGDILQWNLPKLKSKRQYKGHVGSIVSVSVSAELNKMVVGGTNNELTIWDVGNYKKYNNFYVKGIVRSVSINPVYPVCAVGEEEKIQMFQFSSFFPYQTIIPKNIRITNPPKVTALCWSDNLRYLYAGYSDGDIRVYRFKKYHVQCHKKKIITDWSSMYV